jgi:DNA (cytosine-5)-methyltransferase 1
MPAPTTDKPFRYLSVCSGMEAASVAWHPLGWEAAGFSEIEPFPAAILAHRFPNTPNHGDLTQHHTWPIEPGTVDLLVGGTPCQSFSVAGLRRGLADPRGNLALTFLGLADRIRPRWIVWENVPGVLSSGGGRDFGSFLGALVELGYGFAYRVLDAQHFGVPQRRRRVFVVAHLGDWRAPAEVLSLAEGLRGYLEAGGKKRKGPAADAGAGAEAGGGCWWDGGQISQTLDAVLQKGQTMPEKNRFPAVLQPKPVVIDRAAFNQGVNAQYEPHIEESETMDSLVARGPHAVGQPTFPINTLTLGGRPDPVNDARMTMGVGEDGDPQFTLQAAHSHAVATSMAVRRLTPVECERLQGFPDNWSRIPWKGKPEEDCPDGPRYKACGNSMAVPVMAWIGRNIANHEAKQAR